MMENIEDVVRGPFVVNENGTIDCEFNHPFLGWIPFTADAGDVMDYGRDIHAYALTQL